MKIEIFIYLLFIIQFSSSYKTDLLLLQDRISFLQNRNLHLSQKRKKPSSQQQFSYQIFHSSHNLSQIRTISICSQTIFTEQTHFFQTNSEVYYAINDLSSNTLKFYNNRCELLHKIEGIQLNMVLCDRGGCLSGTLYFLTKYNQLYQANQENKFQPILLATLQTGNIIGGLVRNKGKQKIQIFLVYSDGTIKVLDQSGTTKMRLQLDGFNKKVLTLKDHHPFPIISLASGWLTMLDTSKYAQINPYCPNIPQILAIISQTYYKESVYLISTDKIYSISFELSKKDCSIKKIYNLGISLNTINKVSIYGNSLFIDNLIYNMTDKKLYIVDNGQYCNTKQAFFYSKKGQVEQTYLMKKCCDKKQCRRELFEVKRNNEDRSVLFWITLAFVFVLFLSILCMKKSSVHNLDLDDATKWKERQIQRQILELTRERQLKDRKYLPKIPKKMV